MALTELIGKLIGSKANPQLESQLEEERIQKEIDNAYKDRLTGVYNSIYLTKQLLTKGLDKYFQGSRTKVLMIALDNLDEIHRIYGSVKSEKLLKATAQLISSYQKKKFVSRYDQDKFLLVAESRNGDVAEFLEQIKKKLKIYNMHLPEVNLNLTIASTLVSKDETIKDAIAKSKDMLEKEQHSKNSCTESKLKIAAILDRRDEAGLYLKYLLGQVAIENQFEINLLFGPLDYKTRERMERQKTIIQNSGLDVQVFLNYKEFTYFCQTNTVDSAILYKLKEDNQTIAEVLEDLHTSYKKAKTRYLIPQGMTLNEEDISIINKVKQMKFTNVFFPESMNLETLLQSIRRLPTQKTK